MERLRNIRFVNVERLRSSLKTGTSASLDELNERFDGSDRRGEILLLVQSTLEIVEHLCSTEEKSKNITFTQV